MEYYEAYDERYKTMHEKGLAWEKEEPSPVIIDTMRKYNITKHLKLLEIGCGEGRDAGFLQIVGYDVLGTDVSPEAIEYCKKKFNTDKFKVVDAVKDKADDLYDFIYSIATIHMLVKKEDRMAYLNYVHDSLNETGIALICSMGNGRDQKETDINEAFNIVDREHNGSIVKVAQTSLRMVDTVTLMKECKEAKLTVLDSGIVTNTPGFNSMIYVVVKRGE